LIFNDIANLNYVVTCSRSSCGIGFISFYYLVDHVFR